MWYHRPRSRKKRIVISAFVFAGYLGLAWGVMPYYIHLLF